MDRLETCPTCCRTAIIGVSPEDAPKRHRGDCMIAVEKSAAAYSVREADFDLSFRHVGDRWQHAISIRNEGEWFRLLVSEEGTATDDVPPSPPFQDLHFEQFSDDVFE